MHSTRMRSTFSNMHLTASNELKCDTFVCVAPKTSIKIAAVHFIYEYLSISDYGSFVCETENDKLIQSVALVHVYHSTSNQFPFSVQLVAGPNKKTVHSCELHFHLYRIFIANCSSSVTLHCWLSHMSIPSPHTQLGWLENWNGFGEWGWENGECFHVSYCFDSFLAKCQTWPGNGNGVQDCIHPSPVQPSTSQPFPSRNACGKFSTLDVPWRQIKNWSKFGNLLQSLGYTIHRILGVSIWCRQGFQIKLKKRIEEKSTENSSDCSNATMQLDRQARHERVKQIDNNCQTGRRQTTTRP